MAKFEHSSGVTIIELMVAAGIAAVLIAAMSLFVTRALDIPKQEIEQGRINEVARVQMERMSDAIRSATNFDGDDSGEYDGGAERWIQVAQGDDISIYTDIDGDGVTEFVRYWLDGSDLWRRVMKIADDGLIERETIIIATDVQNKFINAALWVSVFDYYSVGGANAVQVNPLVAGLDAVGRVEITLIIDTDLEEGPEEGIFSTVVTPRRGYLAPQ